MTTDYSTRLHDVLEALIAKDPRAHELLSDIAYARREIARRPTLTSAKMLTVFRRDRWVCRYCGIRTIFTPVMALLGQMFPDQFPYHPNWKGGLTHPAILQCSAVVDHLTPGSQGGSWTDLGNLVTACWPCNARKADFSLEQMQWELLPIVESDWDGLTGFYEPLWELSRHPGKGYPPWVRLLSQTDSSR